MKPRSASVEVLGVVHGQQVRCRRDGLQRGRGRPGGRAVGHRSSERGVSLTDGRSGTPYGSRSVDDDERDPDAPPAEEPATPSRRFDRWELAAAVILSLATVASAWSGYQAARWSGQKTKANRATAIAQIDAGRQEALANRQVTIDARGVHLVAGGIGRRRPGPRRRDRGPVPRRVHALPSTCGGHRPPAEALPPGSPFDEDEYQLAADQKADQLTAQADASARRAGQVQPDRRQLRPRCGALRVGAVLRRHLHQALELVRLPPRCGSRPAQCSCSRRR